MFCALFLLQKLCVKQSHGVCETDSSLHRLGTAQQKPVPEYPLNSRFMLLELCVTFTLSKPGDQANRDDASQAGFQGVSERHEKPTIPK